MRRRAAVILSAAILVGLAACGTSGGSATSTTARRTTTTRATTTTEATTTTRAPTTTTAPDPGWTVNSVEAWVVLYQEDLDAMLAIFDRVPPSLDVSDQAAVASFGGVCKDLGAWGTQMADSATIPDQAADAEFRGMLQDIQTFASECTAAVASKDQDALVASMEHYNDLQDHLERLADRLGATTGN